MFLLARNVRAGWCNNYVQERIDWYYTLESVIQNQLLIKIVPFLGLLEKKADLKDYTIAELVKTTIYYNLKLIISKKNFNKIYIF